MGRMTDQPRPPHRRLGGILVDPTPLRLDRDYRLLWIGQASARSAGCITAIVLPYQASVVSGGLLTLAGLGAIALALPEFRRLDMQVAIADVSALGAEDAPIDAPAA